MNTFVYLACKGPNGLPDGRMISKAIKLSKIPETGETLGIKGVGEFRVTKRVNAPEGSLIQAEIYCLENPLPFNEYIVLLLGHGWADRDQRRQ